MTNEEWKKAKEYLVELEKTYLNLSIFKNVNTMFVCRMVIEPLLDRYDNGERTDDLYSEMLAVE